MKSRMPYSLFQRSDSLIINELKKPVSKQKASLTILRHSSDKMWKFKIAFISRDVIQAIAAIFHILNSYYILILVKLLSS